MVWLWLVACGGNGAGGPGDPDGTDPDGPGDGPSAPLVDADGDGFPAAADCDDDDDQVFPGQDESPYDGIDNDCDPNTLDDDLDEDGFDADADCDDQAPDVFPGADEVAGDGIDNDCDPASCHLSGFADTAVDWSLPAGYGTATSTPFALLSSTYADCGSNDPYHAILDVTGDGVQDLVVTYAPCGDQGVGRTEWWVHEGTATGFADLASSFALPSGYGTPDTSPFALLSSTYADCGTNDPYHYVLDLTGDGLLDLVVTYDGCGDALGRVEWLVHEGTGAGFADTPRSFSLPDGYGVPGTAPFALTASTYADCASNDPYHSLLDVTGDGLSDLVVTYAPCGDQGVGRDVWWVHENTGSGFADAATDLALPSGFGTATTTPFALLASTYADCASNDPYHSVLDVTGDGWLDLVVTYAPCGDQGVGRDVWWVYEGGPGGFADTARDFALPGGYGTASTTPFSLLASTYADCGSNDPYHALLDLTADGWLDLVVTYAPCGDQGVGSDVWWVHEGDGSGFATAASTWTLPAAYGTGSATPFSLLASTYADCATNDPYHALLDLQGDGWTDLVVTYAPCGDQGVGLTDWWVHEAVCDL